MATVLYVSVASFCSGVHRLASLSYHLRPPALFLLVQVRAQESCDRRRHPLLHIGLVLTVSFAFTVYSTASCLLCVATGGSVRERLPAATTPSARGRGKLPCCSLCRREPHRPLRSPTARTLLSATCELGLGFRVRVRACDHAKHLDHAHITCRSSSTNSTIVELMTTSFDTQQILL